MYIYVCICTYTDRQQSDILFYRGTVNDRFEYRICMVSGWSMDVSDPEQLSVHYLQPNGVVLHPIHFPPNQRLPKKKCFFSSILFLFDFFTSSFLLLPLFSSLSLFSSHIPLIPRVLSAAHTASPQPWRLLQAFVLIFTSSLGQKNRSTPVFSPALIRLIFFFLILRLFILCSAFSVLLFSCYLPGYPLSRSSSLHSLTCPPTPRGKRKISSIVETKKKKKVFSVSISIPACLTFN